MGLLYTRETMDISSSYPGISNKEVNKQFRILDDAADWQLNPEVYEKNCEKYVKFRMDLFIRVSINNYISVRASWYPTAGAVAVDAFLLICNNSYFYMFSLLVI